MIVELQIRLSAVGNGFGDSNLITKFQLTVLKPVGVSEMNHFPISVRNFSECND